MVEEINIIDDITKENSRTVFFSCEHQKLVELIIESEAYSTHSNLSTHHTTIILCTDEFLQSVDVIPDMHPHKEKSFEDYFVSKNDSSDKNKDSISSVVMHPYMPMPDLSKKTGRDYMKEMDNCIEYIKNI